MPTCNDARRGVLLHPFLSKSRSRQLRRHPLPCRPRPIGGAALVPGRLSRGPRRARRTEGPNRLALNSGAAARPGRAGAHSTNAPSLFAILFRVAAFGPAFRRRPRRLRAAWRDIARLPNAANAAVRRHHRRHADTLCEHRGTGGRAARRRERAKEPISLLVPRRQADATSGREQQQQ